MITTLFYTNIRTLYLIYIYTKLIIYYCTGHGKTHKDAASVRATHPIPAACGLYYFEVRIVSKGRDGYMGIGLSAHGVNMNRLPGECQTLSARNIHHKTTSEYDISLGYIWIHLTVYLLLCYKSSYRVVKYPVTTQGMRKNCLLLENRACTIKLKPNNEILNIGYLRFSFRSYVVTNNLT